MKKNFIFGACSAIAQETAQCFARDGSELYLVDLKMERLQAVRDDILTKSGNDIKIHLKEGNALDFNTHNSLIEEAAGQMKGIDAVLIAHGTLPDQAIMQTDNEKAVREFSINCTGVISLCTAASVYFENKNTCLENMDNGTIAVISSVAGDRGRQSNYLYGAAKGGVTVFLSGLRNRLSKKGINVITIKLGMVDTPMTANMPKGPLFAKAADVGKGIYEAMKNGKDVVYLPGYWRFVMMVIKLIPESIFKKLSL